MLSIVATRLRLVSRPGATGHIALKRMRLTLSAG
jgi:hypothetical protein